MSIQGDLWRRVIKFIKDNNITCPETIYQNDNVVENSFQFIEDLCRIAGAFEMCEERPDEEE